MLLIFAGAGASKAVSPSHYPTTVEFYKGLPKEITAERMFQAALEFLAESETQLDIEVVLWALNQLSIFVDTMEDGSGFPGWLIEKKRAKIISGTNIDIRPTIGLFSTLKEQSDRIRSDINQHVYSLYGRVPESTQLRTTWLPVLQRAAELFQEIQVFTTNYDVVLEEAIRVGGVDVDLGRTVDIQPRLITGRWDREPKGRKGRGLLTKLHGSVDWSRGDDVIHVGTPTFRGDHGDHVIIYPGFKGRPTEEPFVRFHRHFVESAARADAALFVGFSFRDEYINELLVNNLSSDCEPVVINPVRTAVPFQGNRSVHMVKAGFNQNSINKAFKLLSRPV